MTYADELRAELERQCEFRKLPPLFFKMIESYADARGLEQYKRACREVSESLVKSERERATKEIERGVETCSCWNCSAPYDIRFPQCPWCEAINANVDTAGAYKQMETGAAREQP